MVAGTGSRTVGGEVVEDAFDGAVVVDGRCGSAQQGSAGCQGQAGQEQMSSGFPCHLSVLCAVSSCNVFFLIIVGWRWCGQRGLLDGWWCVGQVLFVLCMVGHGC